MVLKKKESSDTYTEWKETLQLLLEEYNDIISTRPMDVGNTDVIQHEIHTTNEVPVVAYG